PAAGHCCCRPFRRTQFAARLAVALGTAAAQLSGSRRSSGAGSWHPGHWFPAACCLPLTDPPPSPTRSPLLRASDCKAGPRVRLLPAPLSSTFRGVLQGASDAKAGPRVRVLPAPLSCKILGECIGLQGR